MNTTLARIAAAMVAIVAAVAATPQAFAQTNGTWNVNANGSWSGTGNWVNSTVASGTDAVANFSTVNLTAGRTITVDGNYTLGTLNAGDATWASSSDNRVQYTFSSGTLTFATSSGTPNINVSIPTGATDWQQIDISSVVAGTSGLLVTQSGATGGYGIVGLRGINTFSGNIQVGSGTYTKALYLDIGGARTDNAQLGSGNFAGNIDIQGNNWFRFITALNNNLSGVISGGTSARLQLVYGTGTTTLSNANTFSGNVIVSADASQSRLQLAHANALQNALLTLNGTNNALQFSPSVGTFNVGRMTSASAAGFALTATDNSAVTLSIGGGAVASDTLSGTISGLGGITKVGSGTLTLSAANAYAGTTAVNAGVLIANNAAALGTTGTVRFGGGTLRYGSGITTDLSGRIAASGSAISVDTGANSVTWATGLASTNTGGLTKLGSGTLTLSNANAYTGTTAVDAGVLQIGNNGSAGGLAASSAITGSSGATLAFNRTDNYGGNFTNAISGGLGVRVNSGTLTLSASNAYTGGSTVSAGRLVVGHVNALGSSTSALAVNGGTLDLDGRSISVGTLSGSSGATITTNSSSGTATLTTTVNSDSTFAGSIADNGSGRVALTKTGGSGNVLTLDGINTFTGDISVAAGFLDIGGSGLLGSGSYAGNISISSAGGGQFRVMANANQTLSGTISGDGTLWMVTGGAGTGTTTLTAANTFTGLALAGNNFATSGTVPTLQLGNANALQSARLQVNAANKLVFSPGIGTFNVGSLEASGTLPGDLTLQDTSGAGVILSVGANNTSTTYARTLSGLGGLAKVGSGTFTLSGANTYSGGSTISAGRVVVGNAAALGASSGALAVNGGTLDLGGFSVNVAALSGSSGAVITTSTAAGTATLTSAVASGTSTFGGVIQNNGSGLVALTKNGSGVLDLLGVSTYTGATAVSAGTLLVSGQLGNTAVTVDSGATLGGSGSIGGAVTVNGLLSPGASPGILSVASLVLGGSGTSLFEIDGVNVGTQYDQVSLTGGLTYGGTLSLNLSQLFGDNTTFNLFSGFTSTAGNLAGITSVGAEYGGLSFTRAASLWTSTPAPNGQSLEFNEATGTLGIVPEPGTLALAAIGIAAAAWARRRR